MKGYSWLSRGIGYCLLNIVLVFLMVFLLLPANTPGVQANSDNATPETILPINDSHSEEPAATDNLSPQIGVSEISEKVVNPDEDTQLFSPGGRIKLEIPKGLVAKSTRFELKEHRHLSTTGMKMVNLFELNASEVDSKDKIKKFKKELEITIQHTPDELAGLDIDSLNLYYLDEITLQWMPVPSQLDRETLTLTAKIDHFSYFGEQANPLQNGPGRVMASQVNLHSGTATYSYPIELPPGPGGFQPSLTLVYNSGSVDEMKNKRDMGSWVGIGWSLDLGKINYDLTTRSYCLEVEGTSYKLICTDNVTYHTNPEGYYKITRSGNTWEVYDKEGTYYRFGGTTDSEQYLTNSIYYRWDLSLFRDTNGNEATVSYVQDIHGTAPNNWVRSAYPLDLTYGAVQIHFTCSWDENTADGYLRYDNPISTTNNPAPKVMENRKLDSIEVKFNGNLIRKYGFSYNTDDSKNRVSSNDYGGIYYSGKFKLLSITQYGSDGTTSLPATTFSYQDLQTYRHTTEGNYTGNPGNPASFSWPHLTAIDSGYGGSVTFTYTQKATPPNPPNSWTTETVNNWTRQVVTGKNISPGIGVNESYTYSYTGDPQYSGSGWDQGYCGFNQVRETDAAGNYIDHYFYTTGTINGQDANKFTGREYETQWYQAGGNLLRKVINTWEWQATDSQAEGTYVGTNTGGTLSEPCGMDVAPDGCVYVTSYYTNRIVKFDANLSYVPSPFDNIEIINPRDVAISSDGYIFVTRSGNNIQKFDSNGNLVATFGSGYLSYPWGITVSGDGYAGGYIYVTDSHGCKIAKFNTNGEYINQYVYPWYYYDYYPYEKYRIWRYYYPCDIAVSSGDDVFTTILVNEGYFIYEPPTLVQGYQNYLDKFFGPTLTPLSSSLYGNDSYPAYIDISGDGNIYTTFYSIYYGYYVKNWTAGTQFSANANYGIAVGERYIYTACGNNVYKYTKAYSNWKVQLTKVEETIGSKTSRTEYLYDSYGNVVTTKVHGDISTNADDATIHRIFYPNTTANILSKPARERVYATITDDNGGANLKKETLYYYDGNNSSYTTPPTKGNLTRVEQKKDASNSISSYNTYDTYGNLLTSTDPNGNVTTWTFETTYNTYPATKTLPVTGLSESYVYAPGTTNLLSLTDVNSQSTTYEYDTFQRLTKVIKPGDSSGSPSVQYQYNNWGAINYQHVKTITKIDAATFLWQTEYFDGLGRVVQVQTSGESGHTIIASATAFNNRGLVDKQYVSQDIASILSSYQTPDASWKYSTSAYDGLGRVATQAGADGTSISHDFSNAWQDLVTNQRGYKTRYYYDAFQHLVKVEELNESFQVYATTTYTYDVLGNLTQVVDNNNNITTMTYDWLSRKTAMTDPDMGSWTYGYDNNGNLTTQTDARSQTITMTYDALNRLLSKTYPVGSNMTDVSYFYDSTSGGNYGKGQRTAMMDAAGTTIYMYDNRGRMILESRVIDSVEYVTSFTYDGADRPVTTTYPTGEVVTQSYNGRGLPYSLSSNSVGNIVNNTLYNNLGMITEINLGNGLKTTYGYYGTGGAYDTAGGYYGRLWEIKTAQDDWLSGWQNRVAITIDPSKIDEDLTYFPVLIHLSGDCGQSSQDMTAVFDEVGANYQKIAVTADDGNTQLYVEVEKWDAVNQEAWLWVSKSGWTISGTANTTLYLYYDNSQTDNTNYVGATGSAPAQAVWDANYVLVDHMQNGTDASHTADSTSYSNNGTKRTVNHPPETTGLIGSGLIFDGTVSGDYVDYPVNNNTDLGDKTAYTIEAIGKPTSDYQESFISQGNTQNNGPLVTLRYQAVSGGASFSHRQDDGITQVNFGYDIATDQWMYLAGVRSAVNAFEFFVNGVSRATSNTDIGTTTIDNIKAGEWQRADGHIFNLDGSVDEVRLSNTARSAAWLKASYYTAWDDLLTFAAPESTAETAGNWLSGWQNRVAITIDPSKIDEDLMYFPVLIHLSGDCGQSSQDMTAVFDEVGANYQKIAVTTENGQTQLYVEVEKWDAAGEETWLWVSQAGWQISGSENTTLYLYYDNSQPDNTSFVGDPGSLMGKAVWDSNYKLVSHMSGSSSVTDSTVNNNTGTKYGPSESAGKIGRGQSFDGANDYIDSLNNNVPTGASARTVEVIAKPNNVSTIQDFISWGQNDETAKLSAILTHSYFSGHLYFATYANNFEATFIPSTTNYNYIAYTLNGTAVSIFMDTAKQSGTLGVPANTTASHVFTGSRLGTSTYFYGIIDEVRISGTVRSDAWLKATFYSCWDYLLTFSEPETSGSQSPDPVALQDIRYTWDAGGNLITRYDGITAETESFTYDFLDRLLTASGSYTESYSYNQIGNIMSRNGVSYTYGAKPHAVTAVGSTSYTYDNNGNMTARGSQTLTWDVENRPVSDNATNASFVYDGDGNRVKKLENGQTIIYVNKYFEKNLTTGLVTSNYYLGGKLVAIKEGDALKYVHQDHLSSTSLTTDASGGLAGSISYLPYGLTRASSGTLPAQQFTGQRLDETGLYYYNARYYDAFIGRFISPDTIIPSPANPQSFNRYSYCSNNPLRYVDPTGYKVEIWGIDVENMTESDWLWIMQQQSEIQYLIFNAFKAWEELEAVATKLTDALKDDDSTTIIMLNPNMDANGQISSGAPNIIEINASLGSVFEDPVESMAATMGHESFHRLMNIKGFTDNSIYEEACAWSIHKAVDDDLHRGPFHDLLVGTNDLTPSMSDAWVKNYFNDHCWKEIYNYANLVANKKFEPKTSEGGYEAMKNFYLLYYPY